MVGALCCGGDGVSTDSLTGLRRPSFRTRRPDAQREIVDAPNTRTAAPEVRERPAGPPDRHVAGAQQGGGERLSAAGEGRRFELAVAGGSHRHGAGAATVSRAGQGGDAGARGAQLGLCGRRAAPQGRDPVAALAGIPRRSPRRVRLRLVLRSVRRLEAAGVADHAPAARRRGEGVRRLCRRHDRPHRPGDRGGDGDEAVRRRHGGLLLRLCRGPAQRGARRLDRLPCEPVRLPGRGSGNDRLRQPQVRRDQGRSLRAGDQPQLPGDGPALRDPPSCPPGPTSRATRPRSSSRFCWSNAG